MKRTIITLIISVLVYIAAYIASEHIDFNGDLIDALVQVVGLSASVGIVGSIIIILYLLDEKR